MTTVYFIRHAESDYSVRDGRIRPLTEKGFADRKLVTEYLQDKNIDFVLSSPFKRAVDTVADFAEKNGFEIESLSEVQERNITALNEVLSRYKNKNIVIGTHGTALSTIINYYDNTYGFGDFMAMVNILPWVVKAEFDGINCARMEKIDLFTLKTF